MTTLIYYYSGSGNSLWIAKQLADALPGAVLSPMVTHDVQQKPLLADVIGFVFPVHVWGVPRHVRTFLHGVSFSAQPYIFGVAVNAGQVSATLVQLQQLLAQKGAALSAGFDIPMPSNYIPFGGADSPEKQQKRFQNAAAKINRIIMIVTSRQPAPIEKGPLWQRILFSAIYKLAYNHIAKSDKKFWTDARCNGCGLCQKVCPPRNIRLQSGKPTWLHHCDQCLACLQWCPQQAIQIGKATLKRQRYHHPEISVKEMIVAD